MLLKILIPLKAVRKFYVKYKHTICIYYFLILAAVNIFYSIYLFLK